MPDCEKNGRRTAAASQAGRDGCGEARENAAPDGHTRPASPRSWIYALLHLSRRSIAAIALAFGVGVIVSWYVSGAVAGSRQARLIEREQLEADRNADVASAVIEQSLSHIQNVAIIIARQPATAAWLSRFGPTAAPSPLSYEERRAAWMNDPELRAASDSLSRIAQITDIGVDECWLMNAAGDAVASGVLGADASVTGANYADREDFKAARRGFDSHQFAIDKVSGDPGLFFVSPITRDKDFLGAVGVRANLASLRVLLKTDVFLADENGVVIVSSNPDLLMGAVEGGKVFQMSESDRVKRYKRAQFETLGVTPPRLKAGENPRTWLDQPYPSVFAVRHNLDNSLSAYSYRYLGEIGDIERDRMLMFSWLNLIVLLSTVCVTGGVVFVKNDWGHRNTLLGIHEKMDRLAKTDPLTGCNNRRHFMEALSREIQRNARYGNPFCILNLDIDHFRQLVERYGSQKSDQILRHFVAVVDEILRPTDLLARMGTQEFSVLLTQTDPGAAAVVAERIRSTIEAIPVLIDQMVIHFTVSVGIAPWRSAADRTEGDVLGRADTAVYEAKKAGRNTVVMENPSPETL
ncbi:MAG: diguanylate cyclase [Desulfovibrionaceae bacterium]|nr:diguanylate cyclase [Desulfovibrionaceae bacterium]MBF0513743.1 diguanylate cyclase [Desulfovibrionaceae bacterium]